MKVSKWGNSLAIRIPADVVQKLNLKEGDELVEISGFGEGNQVVLKRKKTREEFLARLEEIRKRSPIPSNYKFTRADAYDDTER
jgi:antitoxin MazE